MIIYGYDLVYNSGARAGLELTRVAIVTEQTMAVIRARNKAFRWLKGTSGNPSGQSRFYHECRKLAREAAPEVMRELIRLAKEAEDERVKSVCLIAVLDRAGVRGIDFDPNVEKNVQPQFDPRAYSPEQLEVIEAALRLMLNPPKPQATEPEVIRHASDSG